MVCVLLTCVGLVHHLRILSKTRLTSGPTAHRAILITAACITIGFIGLSNHRLQAFESQQSIWADVLIKYPDSPRVLFSNASAAHHSGNDARAEELLRRQLAIPEKRDKSYHTLGGKLLLKILVRQGRWQDASSLAQHIAQVAPQDAEVQQTLGLVLQRNGQPEAAVSAYQRAVSLSPKSDFAHRNLGVLYGQGNQPKLSEQHFRLAIQANPSNPLNHDFLGVLYMRTQRYDAAAACFKAALRLNPQYKDARQRLQQLDSIRRQASPNATHESQ